MSTILRRPANLPLHEQAVFHEGGRVYRVYRFLAEQGPVDRERIIHWCGFPSPRQEPLLAYTRFHNAILRLQAILRPYGWTVAGGIESQQVYRLVGAQP